MKTTLPLTLALAGALMSPLHAEEDLAPPDVDFFVQAQVTQADMDPYGYDSADGLTINVGMWLNSVNLGEKSRFGLEGGFVTQGDVDERSDFTRDPTVSETGAGADSVRVQQESSLELSGFTAGVVWQSPFWLYLKAGGYLYNLKQEDRQYRYLLDTNGDTLTTITDAPQSDSLSGVAPYATAGIAIPVLDNLSLTAQYQVTNLESENFNTLGFGLRFTN
ncbi:porin family protein [Alcanivorax sp. S6407]|uniref:outer membrane beta-barrel protein n=1 Tax=Alcanivorax sp. S6407 TaxID=2926424 RepID=UPI001FF4E9F5|nr:outer membrane beta-barrel protein [Alcanivorax sp. S6407]MCK0152199.1 porin family protein [Alcanivorax sp. S6407]